MKNIISLFRLQQWLKNLFIFLPLFFDGHLLNWHYLLPAFIGFFAFCLATSSIYCFNDIIDAESDRMHPNKKLRPIASGSVSISAGYALMALAFIASVALTLILPAGNRWPVLCVIALYYVMNIAYTLKLKHIAIIDTFIIAIGFVLRIFVGGLSTGVELSVWIVMMTFLLALFLAFAKRRDDVIIYEDTGMKVRTSINKYNLVFINQVIAILASITMVCFIMYTVSPEVMERFHSKHVYLTAVFVLAGIIRYLQITIVDAKSGSPTKVLIHDRFIQLCLIGWIIMFAVIIYSVKL